MTLDAVVIGAGHNGLVAANLLADAGWQVVVCEATSETGGAVRSAELTRPGFVSDLFSAFYPLAVASSALGELELHRHGLVWSHAPAVLAHVFPDGRVASLWRDPARTAESVGSFAVGDAAAWLRLVEEWQRIGPDVLAALLHPFPPVGPTARLIRRAGGADLIRLMRRMLLPVRRFGEETFTGAGAPILLAGNALHADLSPDNAGSAAFGWLLSMLGQTSGFPVPRGGAGELTAALARRLLRAGGGLRTDAPVEQVLVEAGRAVGVRLAGGEILLARQAVLADVNAPLLFGELVPGDALPPRLLRDLADFQWDPPTVKLNWALAEPIPWQHADARAAGTVHLGADLDGMTGFAASLARREIPAEPFVLVGQMTTADPTRSPPGTESAWAYTHLPKRPLTDDDLAAHVERVEQIVERQAPGFSASILARHVQSPTDIAATNPNLWHGSINGGTAQPHQQLMFRPTVGLGGASTPVDRLYLAGASAHPGGGVHGAPGANAARAALRRATRSGALGRRATKAVLDVLYRESPTDPAT